MMRVEPATAARRGAGLEAVTLAMAVTEVVAMGPEVMAMGAVTVRETAVGAGVVADTVQSVISPNR